MCFNDIANDQVSFKWPIFRYLASGCGVHDLDFSYRVAMSVASKIVREVCLSIWSITRPEYISKLTNEQWELTALQFERRANLPHCLGAVEEKYTRVIKPEQIGSMFYYYEEFLSRGINGCADTKYRFV
jgi:hypothetical protein